MRPLLTKYVIISIKVGIIVIITFAFSFNGHFPCRSSRRPIEMLPGTRAILRKNREGLLFNFNAGNRLRPEFTIIGGYLQLLSWNTNEGHLVSTISRNVSLFVHPFEFERTIKIGTIYLFVS